MLRALLGILMTVPLLAAGCSQSARADEYTQRRQQIDAAYQRGEITFQQHQQLTNDLERLRIQKQQAEQAEFEALQRQFHRRQPEVIYPRNAEYQLYDQYGRPVGTARPR